VEARDQQEHVLQMAQQVRRREVADVEQLRELQTENAKLTRMYADLALENAAIKDVLNQSCKAACEATDCRGAGARASAASATSLSRGEAFADGVLPASGAGEPA
jgi:hypothetical protein